MAAALQTALSRFAKPWFRRRALRIFRDDTSLSASPGLWPSIVQALDHSSSLILLASANAARSPWVEREVAYWLEHRDREKILIAVTDEISLQAGIFWDAPSGDFDWERTTVLPRALSGAFADEPRYIQLGWARGTRERLSLRDPVFRSSVAELAAPLHNRPKDELIGEDLTQHRRVRRLVAVAVAALVAATVVATSAALIAVGQRNEARHQTDLAVSRQLAGDAVTAVEDKFDLGLLLAAAAYRFSDTVQARSALVSVLQQRSAFVEPEWRPGPGDDAPVLDRTGQVVGVVRGSGVYWFGHGPVSSGIMLHVPFPPSPIGGRLLTDVSPDGRLLAVGMPDGRFVLWEVTSGRHVATIRDRPRITRSGEDPEVHVLFIPSGSSLVTWGHGAAHVWDVATLERRSGPLDTTPPGRPGWSMSYDEVAVSPDGKTVVTLGEEVTFWDMASLERIGSLPTETSEIGAVFSPDGRTLAIVSNFGARFVDVATRQALDRTFSGPNNIYVAAWSGDGRTLVLGGDEGILLFDAESGSQTAGPLTLHPAGSGNDGIARLYVDGTGRQLLSFGKDGGLRWDIGRRNRLLEQNFESTAGITGLSASPREDVIALRTDDGIELRDTATGVPIGPVLPVGAGSVVFSPDGRLIAANSERGVTLWDVQTGKQDGSTLFGFDRTSFDVAFSPDGRLLASGEATGVTVWDVRTRQRVAVLRDEYPDLPWVNEVTFSPDGGLLAVASGTGIELWSTMTWSIAGQIENIASTVAFSPDGRTLASANEAGDSVVFWDVATHSRTGEALIGQSGIDDVAFSPDGSMLVTSSGGSVTLWDSVSYRAIGALSARAGAGGVRRAGIAFDRRGRLVSVVDETTAGMWAAAPEAWVDVACATAGRDFTREEWSSFVGSIEYRKTCEM